MHSGYVHIPPSFEKTLDNYFAEQEKKVTVGIPFKGRLDTLSNTLLSIAFQTQKPHEVILVDDSDNPQDLRELPAYKAIFNLFNFHKIEWQVVFGRKLGQHHSHQIVQDIAKHPIIWRIDSDEIAEKNVLQGLLDCLAPEVGAVGGLVPQDCPPPPLPENAANIISDLNRPNIQWFKHPTRKALAGESGIVGLIPNVVEVEHLTSSFIYRKGVARYELSLSPAAFREETLLTYEIKRKGFKLIVNPNVTTWHFPNGQGRHENIHDWENDDKYFEEKRRNWGVQGKQCKLIVLDCGKGDHVVAKSLVPELKEKYGELTIACCFPDVFYDVEDIRLISIAEAKGILGQIDSHNIYRHMIDLNHQKPLIEAYRSLYNLGESPNSALCEKNAR